VKFLCVECDEPMTLAEAAPPERGSLSLVYSCPKCARRIAMLTNPYETQVVGSLGVRIGPEAGVAAGDAAERAERGGCPFSDIVAGMAAPAEEAGRIPWTAPALARLSRIPEFVRPMARTGIERFARENGHDEVDEAVLDRARDFFGM
jgi:hypothetical protein